MATAAHEENETGYVFDGDGRPVIEKEGMRSIIGLNPDPMVIHTEGYQVWSTVLGASLTTVDMEGDKRHTKVFAGGAHIATQDANATTSTGDDRILFTSADPVTGTKVTFNYTDGVGFFAREDTEPLGGQQIERNDPVTGYPTDYGQVLGTPRDPEWQCVAARMRFGEDGFRDMPVHCQKAVSEWSVVDFGAKVIREASPNKITAVDSPVTTISCSDSTSARALSISTRATYKQSTDGISGDGEGCDPDDPYNPCTVTIKDPGPSTDLIAANDAENGIGETLILPPKEQLGSCVMNLLAGYFPDYIVNGTPVSIAAHARFVVGIPSWAAVLGSVSESLGMGVSPAAMTQGLYNIHYDPAQIDLVSPSWGVLETIIEELTHGEQFIQMWIDMPNIYERIGDRFGSRTVIGRNPIANQVMARRPTHDEALSQWNLRYAAASIAAASKKFHPYHGNEYEISAKARAATIIQSLRTKNPNRQKLCP